MEMRRTLLRHVCGLSAYLAKSGARLGSEWNDLKWSDFTIASEKVTVNVVGYAPRTSGWTWWSLELPWLASRTGFLRSAVLNMDDVINCLLVRMHLRVIILLYYLISTL